MCLDALNLIIRECDYFLNVRDELAKIAMKNTIKHTLSNELARKATEKAFQSYAERFAKYHPAAQWTSENVAHVSFQAKGVHLEGNISLRKGAIDLEMHVPVIFMPLRSMAMEIIEEEIHKWIAKAEAGELDE